MSDRRLRHDVESNLHRILAAAAEVFAGQGLSATLADVAKHAGVGVGTLYRKFANKDDLIYEVYAGRIRQTEELAREASEQPDVWAAFVAFLERSIEDLAVDKGLRELGIGGYTESLGWARGTPPERLAKLLTDNHGAMGVHLGKLVNRAKEAGVLRADFEASDMMVLSLSIQSAISYGGPDHPEFYRRVLTFILDGLQPARAAPTPVPVPALTEKGSTGQG
ncbi:MAG: TetR/AcrR family transcriptional regulator [Kibdelosporangium sp.]